MKLKRCMRFVAALYFAIIVGTGGAAANEARVEVLVNGEKLFSDTSAVLKDGTTYVPLRAFAERFSSAQVSWDAQSRSARVEAPGLQLTVREGREYMVANGRYFYMKDSVLKRDGRILVPVRALSAAYGLEVQWLASSRTVSLSGSFVPAQSGETFYDADAVYWLSRIIHAESQGEPLRGKIAVGNVVLNRVRSEQFPNTIYGVIFDTAYGVQFTPAANGTIYGQPGQESVIAAKLCLDGAQAVPQNCLYFLNASLAVNFWIPQNRPYLTAIGNHQFYA